MTRARARHYRLVQRVQASELEPRNRLVLPGSDARLPVVAILPDPEIEGGLLVVTGALEHGPGPALGGTDTQRGLIPCSPDTYFMRETDALPEPTS